MDQKDLENIWNFLELRQAGFVPLFEQSAKADEKGKEGIHRNYHKEGVN